MLQNASDNLTASLQWKSVSSSPSGRDRMISESYSQEDINNGFRVDVSSPKIALGDRLRMVFAAVFAVTVPFIFLLALMAVTCSWLNLTWYGLTSGVAQESWMNVVLVLGNLFLLGYSVALVRRLLIVQQHSRATREQLPDAQPELHAFVNRVASLLQGPPPSSIKLDSKVGLILRPSGFSRVLTGGGPDLVIGLPLLYGLSARQLSGVIAHAYAGYTREARLHGYPLLCSIDRWLLMQAGLGRISVGKHNESALVKRGVFGTLIKPFDELVRGSFYLMYRVLSVLTFDVSRKVDMAGDQFSARIAGSTEFRSTQFRLRSLHYGQVNANQELFNSFHSKKLPDNFSALVVDHADTLQLTLRPRLIQEMEELVTPLSRSRIVDLGRIVNVEMTQEEGACFLLGSAISLLRDPVNISRNITLDHYHQVGIRQPELYSSPKPVTGNKPEQDRVLRHDVLNGLERSARIICLEDFERYGALSVESRLVEYRELSKQLQQKESHIVRVAEKVREYELRKNLLQTRKVVEECRNASPDVIEALEVQWLECIRLQGELTAQLVPSEHLFSRKAAIGMSLALDAERVRERIQMNRQEMYSHLLRVFDALSFLHRCFESIQRLRAYTQVLGQLLVESSYDALIGASAQGVSLRYQKYLLIELDSLMKVLNGLSYPLGGAPAQGQGVNMVSLGEVVVREVADIDSAHTCPEACHRVANALCHYLESLNEQLQQRISQVLQVTEQHYLVEAVLPR